MNFVDFLLPRSMQDDKVFIAGVKEWLTYGELRSRVESVSKWLAMEYGSRKEFLLLADNSVFFVIAYLATMRSGNVPLLVETRINKEELSALMSSCRPVAAFIQKRSIDLAPTDLPTITESDIDFEEVDEDLREQMSEDDLAAVVFTSGSTGMKKGVMVTHGNLIANTNSIVEYLELTENDRIMVVLPFYYCYGASLLHTHLRVGGSIVLSHAIFLGAVLEEMNKFECTGFAGVPSTYQILINRTKFLEHRFTTLRYMTQAGGKLEAGYIERIVNAFPGLKFYVMYGATEATARMSYLPPDRLREKIASIGKGIPGVHLEVLDENGMPIRPGDTGEITAAGKNIMKGYYGDEEGTRCVLRSGRYYTGDLATIDEDGFIYVVGRAKDIIKCAGYRISPYEIENLIHGIEGADSVAVVGIPDEILGEAIVAVVRKKEGALDPELRERIMSTCRRSVPSYKRPKYIVFVSEIPLNSSNKVDKVRIREMLKNGEISV